MADISLINVGGINYEIKDRVAREKSSMYGKNIGYDEPGNTASQPYPKVGTIIFWHSAVEPIWVYTKTAIAKGERFQLGVNIEQKPTLGTMISDIKTYVDSNGKLHFVDSRGADTELNFSSDPFPYMYHFSSYPANAAWLSVVENGTARCLTATSGSKISYDGLTMGYDFSNGHTLQVTGKFISGYILRSGICENFKHFNGIMNAAVDGYRGNDCIRFNIDD